MGKDSDVRTYHRLSGDSKLGVHAFDLSTPKRTFIPAQSASRRRVSRDGNPTRKVFINPAFALFVRACPHCCRQHRLVSRRSWLSEGISSEENRAVSRRIEDSESSRRWIEPLLVILERSPALSLEGTDARDLEEGNKHAPLCQLTSFESVPSRVSGRGREPSQQRER